MLQNTDEMTHSTYGQHEKNLGKKELQEKQQFKDRLKRGTQRDKRGQVRETSNMGVLGKQEVSNIFNAIGQIKYKLKSD